MPDIRIVTSEHKATRTSKRQTRTSGWPRQRAAPSSPHFTPNTFLLVTTTTATLRRKLERNADDLVLSRTDLDRDSVLLNRVPCGHFEAEAPDAGRGGIPVVDPSVPGISGTLAKEAADPSATTVATLGAQLMLVAELLSGDSAVSSEGLTMGGTDVPACALSLRTLVRRNGRCLADWLLVATPPLFTPANECIKAWALA
jgi:hypothetical protein